MSKLSISRGERSEPRENERAIGEARSSEVATSFPTPGTYVSFRVWYSRDLSRLSQSESLLAG